MIGRTNAGGGGGSGGLNYSVVGGTTKPSNPKENTIFINTSAGITSHIFSASKPSSPAEGMAWINTNGASASSFNALKKKNWIVLLPGSVNQYIKGVWVALDAYIYKTSWVRISYAIQYLYNKGDKCASVHGGWVASTRMHASNAKTPTLTFGGSTMTASITGTTLNYESGCIETVNGLNLTNFKTIKFVVTGYSLTNTQGGQGLIQVGVHKGLKDSQIWFAAGNYKDVTGTGTYTLDVSSLSGVHDIVIYLKTDVGTGNTAQITISQIYAQ